LLIGLATWISLRPYKKAKSVLEINRRNSAVASAGAFHVTNSTEAATAPRTNGKSKRLSVFDSVQQVKANPFVNESHKVDENERIRVVIASMTYVPFRIAAVIITVLVGALVAQITLFGLNSSKPTPIKGWRLIPQQFLKFLFRIILYWCGYLWIERKGDVLSKEQGANVVIANHLSFVEPIYLLSLCQATPVAAEDNMKIPFIGSIFQALQTVPVQRENSASKHAVLDAIKARSADPAFPSVLIFPEGTCTNGASLITFKIGAFVPGLPVQPIAIRYNCPNSAPFWVCGAPSLPMLIFRVIAEPINYLHVDCMPLYVPNEEEKKNAVLFAGNVRQAMCERLNCPNTNHSYLDVLLQTEALKMKADSSCVSTLEYSNLQEKLHLDLNQAKSKVREFSIMAQKSKKAGKVSLSDFESFYQVQGSEFARHLFHLLDRDDNGEIDFYEFMVGLGGFHLNDSKKLSHLAFLTFDLDGDGYVNISDLAKVMKQYYPAMNDVQIQNVFNPYAQKKDKSDDVAGVMDEAKFEEFLLANPIYAQEFAKTFKLE
jgi:lysophosphatidylcholine acyltransferase/lyso-PAF acetyltransferase